MILHRTYILFTVISLLLLCGFYLHSRQAVAKHLLDDIPAQQQLVKSLGLTDLSIWTEARYTRHPTQADIFTAFQDLPSSLEHFPAGSIMSPVFSGTGTSMKFRRAVERGQP